MRRCAPLADWNGLDSAARPRRNGIPGPRPRCRSGQRFGSSPPPGTWKVNDPPFGGSLALLLMPGGGLGFRSRTSCALPPARLSPFRPIHGPHPHIRSGRGFGSSPPPGHLESKRPTFRWVVSITFNARGGTCPTALSILLRASGPPRALPRPSMGAHPRFARRALGSSPPPGTWKVNDPPFGGSLALLLMPGGGLEPPRPCEHQYLKLACLPFHHPGG